MTINGMHERIHINLQIGIGRCLTLVRLKTQEKNTFRFFNLGKRKLPTSKTSKTSNLRICRQKWFWVAQSSGRAWMANLQANQSRIFYLQNKGQFYPQHSSYAFKRASFTNDRRTIKRGPFWFQNTANRWCITNKARLRHIDKKKLVHETNHLQKARWKWRKAKCTEWKYV